MNKFSSIKETVSAFRSGKIVIVFDDRTRENEGDLICAAEKITPEKVNFMTKHGRGLICVPISPEIAKKINLKKLVKKNTDHTKCNFTISVDLKKGTSTGISAFDRSKTIKAFTQNNLKPEDFARPGHVFPIIVDNKGVLKRPGHSEAAVDLAKLSGLKPAGVICEILREDGRMARLKDLFEFAKKHNLKIICIKDLIDYRI